MARGKCLSLLYTAAAVSVAGIPAFAQIPGSSEAGRLQERWETGKTSQSRPRAESSREHSVTPAVEPVVPEKPLLTLRQVQIQGIPAEDIPAVQKPWQLWLGKSVSEKRLNVLLEETLRTCRQQGLLFCSTRDASADVDSGTLRLVLDGGQLQAIDYRTSDNTPVEDASGLLKQHRQWLLERTPIRTTDIERALLLLNDLPGVTAKGTLSGQDDGVHLIVTIDRDPWERALTANNRGSNFVGPFQFGGNVLRNGAFAPFDQLGLRVVTGTDNQELLAGEVSYKIPLNARGTLLDVSALKTWSEPGYTLAPFRLESTSQRFQASVSHPLKRTLYESLSIEGGFVLSDTTTKSFGTLFSEDRVRSLRGSVQYDVADRWGGLNVASFEMRQGLDILDSSESGSSLLSRRNGKSNFTKTEFYASRQQPLGKTFTLTASVSAQYALTQLLSGEEFGIGGTQFGRGYDPSEVTGDHGIATLLEFSWDPVFDKPDWVSGLQFYASYDAGVVWRIDTDTRQRQLTAVSSAIGLRLNLKPDISLDLQIAKPLTRGNSSYSESDAKDARVFGSVTVRF